MSEPASVEISEYRPVFINEQDEDPEELETSGGYYTSKCCVYWQIFMKICLLLHEGFFKYVRENVSGITSQPVYEVYVTDCSFTWDNISRGFDIWLFIHFGANTLFTLGIRDRRYMWLNSIMWEIIEFIYYRVPAFNMTVYQECWYDIIIFDILIFNALGIEFGLIVLKYIFKIYPLYPEWTIAFKMLCKDCKCGKIKLWIIVINLVFLASLIQLFTFAFWDYTFWIGSTSFLGVIRFIMLQLSCIGVFGQLYKLMFIDIACWNKIMLKNSYWIIIVWIIIGFESVLTIRHYLS